MFLSFLNMWSPRHLDTRWRHRWSYWGAGGSLRSTEQSFAFGDWEKQEADVTTGNSVLKLRSAARCWLSLPVLRPLQSTKLQSPDRRPGLHRRPPPAGLHQPYGVLQPVVHVASKEPADGRKLGQNLWKHSSSSISVMQANVRKLKQLGGWQSLKEPFNVDSKVQIWCFGFRNPQLGVYLIIN